MLKTPEPGEFYRNSKNFFLFFSPEREVAEPTYYVREGEAAQIILSKNAQYCDVKRLSALGDNTVYENCNVTISSMPRSLSGIWYTQAGVTGQVKDVSIRPKVIISSKTN